MNKDHYKSAVCKIKASDAFKLKVKKSLREPSATKKPRPLRKPASAIAALIAIACIGLAVIPSLLNGAGQTGLKNDSFQITGENQDSACYIAVVYLDGYAYTDLSGWLGYSRHNAPPNDYEAMKGEKIGEVTLDLTSITYTGTPPDFSSTMGLGTEIYAIEGVKVERAVMIVSGDYASIFYRERKALPDEKTPIDLTMEEVIAMLTDTPPVCAVELRDDYDGAWMRTSEDGSLLSLINAELPGRKLLNAGELAQNPYDFDERIPVNLMFADGAALHMQVFPRAGSAYLFGGYITLSGELTAAFEALFAQGGQYPRFGELLPFTDSVTEHLSFINHTSGAAVTCENPAWCTTAWFDLLNYYRVEDAAPAGDKSLVFSCSMGKSAEDCVTIDFYETAGDAMVIDCGGRFYKPVKGRLTLDDLNDFLYSYTDLGLNPVEPLP